MEQEKLPSNYLDMRLVPYKKDLPYSYTYGVFPTIELVDNCPSAVFRIVVSSKIRNGFDLLKERASRLGIPLVVDDKTIERLSPKDNCFAIGVFRKFYNAPDPKADHIVLVNPSDMGNLGTIIRTTAAYGFKSLAIILPAADLFNPHTVRASMGAIFRVKISLFKSFEDYRKICGDREFYPFMLDGRPMGEVDLNPPMPASLVFGNESSGLPADFQQVGQPVRIMHESTVDSLNLTIAAGIGMNRFYEMRQK